VLVDGAGRVGGFIRPGGSPGAGHPGLHFVGVQVVEAAVFADLPPDEPGETVRQIYPALIERDPNAVQAFLTGAVFHDVGTPADYLQACLAVAAAEGLDDLPRGAASRVAPGARLVRSVVWDDVTIGEECEVVESVVADGVRVPRGTRLAHTAVVPAAGRTAGPGEVIRDGMLMAPLSAPDEPGSGRHGRDAVRRGGP
jgi:NDP-sugar pyrophosphorylase family protein